VHEKTTRKPIPAPLGSVEPHAPMLNVPPADQMLFKMMTMENLLRSIMGSYLHFNRVDCYIDFPGADPHDGQQLPKDRQGNAITRFEKTPEFTAADYYDQSRARTYACCFSLENSDVMWSNYANGSEKGKVCVVLEFGKLRATLNKTLQPVNAALEYNHIRCRQIFSVNYGIVEYVEWDRYQANATHLLNPIRYTYLKDKKNFAGEKELRVSLSAPGIGQFALNDGSTIDFPPSLQLFFDFKNAIADGTIRQILCAPDCDSDFLYDQRQKLCIVPSEDSDPPLSKI
jgi:hypothetical protein